MPTVYVLGELNIDLIASAHDVTPQFNKEKLLDSFDLALGSSSAITACALAGLGLSVVFVSVAGDDMFGRFCKEQLEQKGVDTRFVLLESGMRTGVTLSLSAPRDRALLTYMGSIPCLEPGHVPEELFAQADHVHFGSYYLQDSMREHWPSVFAKAREAGISTSFDTGWDPRETWHREGIAGLLPHTDLFMPSEEEIRHIFAASSVQEALERLPAERGGIAAVKQGSAGSCYVNADGDLFRHAGFKVDPVDTTGAGDSFNAGMIFGFLRGWRGEELLAYANACGALATLRIGGASSVPSLSEVERFMSGRKG